MTASFSVGDTVCFNDDWFLRRRMPLVPIEERTEFIVKAVGDDRVMVSFNEDGKSVYQLLQTTWLQKVPKEADAESASPQ